MPQSQMSDLLRRKLEFWSDSDARLLFDRLETYSDSLTIFGLNFEGLVSRIESAAIADPDSFERFLIDYPTVRIRILRNLHNFLAAAYSLIDHTRIIYRELYATHGLIPDFDAEVKRRFHNDPVAGVIKGLRQFCQHYRVPLAGFEIAVDARPTPESYSTTVSLIRDDLQQFSGWNAAAKQYISDAPSEIPLLPLVQHYHESVLDFDTWFKRAQQVRIPPNIGFVTRFAV